MSTDRRKEAGTRQDRITEHSLDALTKALASRTLSRGRALKLAGAALLGNTGLLALFPRAAWAQTVGNGIEGPTIQASDPGCQGEPAIDNRRCPGNTCWGRSDCLCTTTVDGDKKCVELLFESCPNRDQCDSNRDCPQGELCVKVGGCCGNRRRNLCAFPCG